MERLSFEHLQVYLENKSILRPERMQDVALIVFPNNTGVLKLKGWDNRMCVKRFSSRQSLKIASYDLTKVISAIPICEQAGDVLACISIAGCISCSLKSAYKVDVPAVHFILEGRTSDTHAHLLACKRTPTLAPAFSGHLACPFTGL